MDTTERFLTLLKKSLTNEVYLENELRIFCLAEGKLKRNWPGRIDFEKLHHIGKYFPEDLKNLKAGRKEGKLLKVDTPHLVYADTMIGMRRLDNIQYCLQEILKDDVPGDVIECGVWRGGAAVFMKALLEVFGIEDRNVWLADSFEGVPKSTLKQDQIVDLSKKAYPGLAIPIEDVRSTFSKYDVSLDKVNFLEGWFKDTLPHAPIEQLSLLRLDGDLYESTWDILKNLYYKLSNGGFVIVDDYHALPQCKEAVLEFRSLNNIQDTIMEIDSEAIFWRKGN